LPYTALFRSPLAILLGLGLLLQLERSILALLKSVGNLHVKCLDFGKRFSVTRLGVAVERHMRFGGFTNPFLVVALQPTLLLLIGHETCVENPGGDHVRFDFTKLGQDVLLQGLKAYLDLPGGHVAGCCCHTRAPIGRKPLLCWCCGSGSGARYCIDVEVEVVSRSTT